MKKELVILGIVIALYTTAFILQNSPKNIEILPNTSNVSSYNDSNSDFIPPFVENNTICEGPHCYVVKKPTIYLYPTSVENVSIILHVHGSIIASNPMYNKGWKVLAYPNGTIIYDNKSYDYLFYEVLLSEIPSAKYMGDLAPTYDNLYDLAVRLGLIEREAREFARYWSVSMRNYECVQIYLLPESEVSKLIRLDIDPTPTTEIRRIFVFKPVAHCENPINIQASKVGRGGFTVVEWGGILLQ